MLRYLPSYATALSLVVVACGGAATGASTATATSAGASSTPAAAGPAAAAPAARPVAAGSCPAGMSAVAGGSFVMRGERDASNVAPFCIDQTEVTTSAYAACVKTGTCTVDPHPHDRDMPERELLQGCNYGAAGHDSHPMNCVSWGEARAYCRAQSKRLPTMAEWEWAARGGADGRMYPWGDDKMPRGKEGCWSVGDNAVPRRNATCPVGSYPKTDAPGGVHDLLGNVIEWTSEGCNGCGTAHSVRGDSFGGIDPSIGGEGASFSDNRNPRVGFRCIQ